MDEQEFRDLQERSALIGEMASHPGWALLVDRARVSIFREQRRMILGKLNSYEEYQARVAWMDGVSHLIDLPKTVEMELEVAIQQRNDEGSGDRDV